MPELDVETARWLVSDAGMHAVERATTLLDEGHELVETSTRLATLIEDPARRAAALGAAVARSRARAHWPDADRLLFTRESLEQASNPQVSAWRATRFTGRQVWDLCAGVGGDALELAPVVERLVAVDVDPARLVLLDHNLRARGHEVELVEGDALAVAVPAGASVHADPARRVDGHRVRRLAEHRPSVPALFDRHHGVAGLGVVLSPAVRPGPGELPADVEVEFIQVGTRLVEAVAYGGELRRRGVHATATVLPQPGAASTPHTPSGVLQRHRLEREPRHLPIGDVGDWLVEVAPAAVRARLHDALGAEIGARRLAARRALLTTDTRPPSSAWYRARAVLAVLPARPRAVRSWLRTADAGPVEVAVHGLQADPDRWWRELGRPPRGPDGVRIELVRLDVGATAVLTRAR